MVWTMGDALKNAMLACLYLWGIFLYFMYAIAHTYSIPAVRVWVYVLRIYVIRQVDLRWFLNDDSALDFG